MSQMIDLEIDQQSQGHFYPEPCILLGGAASFSQPNIRTAMAGSGHTTNVDSQYVPEHFDNTMMYGMPQYNGVQNQHVELGVAPAANLYYSGMTPPSGTGMLPVPLNYRASDQLPSSSTYAISGGSSDNFGRSSHYMDDIRGQCKRKNVEGITGAFQYFNASASSSSSMAPPNARHPDGVAVMDATSFFLPHYRGTVTPSLMEVGSQSSLWSRSGESLMGHDHNHMIQGNYMGQHFQPAATPWMDQQLSSSTSDGHNLAWSQSVAVPYIQASNVIGGSLETGNMGVQRHQTASNRTGPRFLHPPVNHWPHNYHPTTMPMHGGRGHNINFPSQINTPSYRVPTNPSRNTVVPAQNGFEMGPRHLRPAPPSGIRVYHPPRGVVTDANFGHRNLPRMRVLPADEVAILEMPDFYEVGNLVDHHRDMRLDIEDMSYEELLALGEQIGNVSTGLSEETIINELRTKTYFSSATAINLEEAACEDQDVDSCIICQDEYKHQEKIGVLKCGHEYHVDCLKKWLLVKNVCPICKSEAVLGGRMYRNQ
ncbi:RING/U-box superfamily protein [Quillaja saponaria]|uniref:RING-type E3 ubiquitin transferase n=1 Tax=Quillaja saponaria TaxID=32244 RepID=A0AAD7QHT9_QUISA|nr:RING/U-box superfamily protein [Quillaja saponaria]